MKNIIIYCIHKIPVFHKKWTGNKNTKVMEFIFKKVKPLKDIYIDICNIIYKIKIKILKIKNKPGKFFDFVPRIQKVLSFLNPLTENKWSLDKQKEYLQTNLWLHFYLVVHYPRCGIMAHNCTQCHAAIKKILMKF